MCSNNKLFLEQIWSVISQISCVLVLPWGRGFRNFSHMIFASLVTVLQPFLSDKWDFALSKNSTKGGGGGGGMLGTDHYFSTGGSHFGKINCLHTKNQ